MNKLYLSFLVVLCLSACSTVSAQVGMSELDPEEVVLESWTYASDFEDRTLGAWAAYPLWQDIAYNPQFRANEIIPGDPNVSIVQR
ncbi:MAG: hypothetical protein WD317_09135, partial [Balneolaceae bacterium]